MNLTEKVGALGTTGDSNHMNDLIVTLVSGRDEESKISLVAAGLAALRI